MTAEIRGGPTSRHCHLHAVRSFNWAVAFQNEVTVFSAPPASTGPDAEGAQRLGSSTAGQNTITSLLWVVWDGCTQPTAQSHPAPHVEPLACILVGTSAGYLQVHDSKGSVLFRQRLHGTAVQSMQLRTTSMGGCRVKEHAHLSNMCAHCIVITVINTRH